MAARRLGLFSATMAVMGDIIGGGIANSSGVFLWVWTLLTLGVTTIFSAILSAR